MFFFHRPSPHKGAALAALCDCKTIAIACRLPADLIRKIAFCYEPPAPPVFFLRRCRPADTIAVLQTAIYSAIAWPLVNSLKTAARCSFAPPFTLFHAVQIRFLPFAEGVLAVAVHRHHQGQLLDHIHRRGHIYAVLRIRPRLIFLFKAERRRRG